MRTAIHWTPARLLRTHDVARDIRLFEIAPEGGARTNAPGSHINVALVINDQADSRSYSIVDSSLEAYRIAVKRCAPSRGGSQAMWRLPPGAPLTISEPHNHFALDFDRTDYLLVAGGIGVTPLMGMAAALARTGKAYRFVHVAPTRTEAAFVQELRDAHQARYEPRYSREGATLDLALEIARLAPQGQLYFCGPMRLLQAARAAWSAAGRHAADLRFETFASGGRYAAEAFTVKIPRAGLEVRVGETETMLAALARAGVDIMSDCQRGECGLCAVDVLGCEGTIDHRDVFFSEREHAQNAKMCACVSRALGGGVSIDTAFRSTASLLDA
ncbi:PDR/VanB family oxidoreductase [Methylocapsa sp. S129]|uniref:PDR/VanB family oxidoreductase n=1 Tax=Methylocapsa sp. S129 TaxID=1641869 RepID=UPI00131EAA4A|nr:PDR/VanB family oxidoreductase [Methylocapsa sp. S129]